VEMRKSLSEKEVLQTHAPLMLQARPPRATNFWHPAAGLWQVRSGAPVMQFGGEGGTDFWDEGIFFGLGPSEIAVVLVLAYFILGPKELFRLIDVVKENVPVWQNAVNAYKDNFVNSMERELIEDQQAQASGESAGKQEKGFDTWLQESLDGYREEVLGKTRENFSSGPTADPVTPQTASTTEDTPDPWEEYYRMRTGKDPPVSSESAPPEAGSAAAAGNVDSRSTPSEGAAEPTNPGASAGNPAEEATSVTEPLYASKLREQYPEFLGQPPQLDEAAAQSMMAANFQEQISGKRNAEVLAKYPGQAAAADMEAAAQPPPEPSSADEAAADMDVVVRRKPASAPSPSPVFKDLQPQQGGWNPIEALDELEAEEELIETRIEQSQIELKILRAEQRVLMLKRKKEQLESASPGEGNVEDVQQPVVANSAEEQVGAVPEQDAANSDDRQIKEVQQPDVANSAGREKEDVRKPVAAISGDREQEIL